MVQLERGPYVRKVGWRNRRCKERGEGEHDWYMIDAATNSGNEEEAGCTIDNDKDHQPRREAADNGNGL